MFHAFVHLFCLLLVARVQSLLSTTRRQGAMFWLESCLCFKEYTCNLVFLSLFYPSDSVIDIKAFQ